MNYTQNTLNFYKRNLSGCSVISKKEEMELGRLAKQGDAQAREKLIFSNAGYVIKRAMTEKYKTMDEEDYIQESFCGMIEAEKDFSPEKNIRLITYADKKITNRFCIADETNGSNLHIPDKKFKLAKKINGIYSELELNKTNDKNLTTEKIILFIKNKINQETNLNLSISDIENYLQLTSTITSLNTLINSDDSEETELMDMISDKTNKSIEEITEEDFFLSEFYKAVHKLPEIERTVLILYSGIFGRKKFTLKEIGEKFNRTKAWAGTIVKKAQHHIKENSPELELYIA